VKHPHLVRRELANDRVQDAAVVEEHEVLLVPIVRVHKLRVRVISAPRPCRIRENGKAYGRRDGGALHLVEELTDLLQVREVCTIGVERAVTRCAGRKGIDEKLFNTTWVNLEVKVAGHRVFPGL
jgi:hypothetical protein